MRRMSWRVPVLLLSCLVGAVLSGCSRHQVPGGVLDEAMQANRAAASFPQASEDYFHDMDRGVGLTSEQVQGRNMWIVWTGGNDRFWDSMTKYTFGALDLLKVVTSDPSMRMQKSTDSKEFSYRRATRWKDLGLVNEPCFEEATGPDKARFDLWLDVRSKDCPADPFEDGIKYPGVRIGARGKSIGKDVTLPVGSYYGYATGIVGLRLFPNPEFDEKAYKHWDAKKYYSDPSYYNDPKLVRPYRVGMSCGFCHVGPSPVSPPADPENPAFANLSSSVGAQYMWVDRLFVFNANNKSGLQNFTYQMLHTWRPGSMDTSLVSTDNINNPRTMNAVYSFKPRLAKALQLWHEKLARGELNNKQFNDFVPPNNPLAEFWDASTHTSMTPHVLKDGSDSVGLLGALNRVYLNIGLFSEEWLLHFNPVVGGKPISPIEIAVADKNSAYWQATTQGTPKTALFFLEAAQPDRLADAPGGRDYLSPDAKLLERGKQVFADTCARCHSSKGPVPPERVGSPASCAGPGYLDCFKRYWAWTQTDEFKQKMRSLVLAPDFLENNYLSSDARIPVTLLRTNVCSPLATNALAGNIWDNFSSDTYKSLPSVGSVTLRDPFSGEPYEYPMPDGGRGYTRVPSLIGLWSTAPFLLNNTVGSFDWDPSVEHRVKAFDQAIEQMLWPEKRELDKKLGSAGVGKIDRTTARSALRIPVAYVPSALRPLEGFAQAWIPSLTKDDNDIVLGPIPEGTPVGLLASLKLRAESDDLRKKYDHAKVFADFIVKLNEDLRKAPPHATDDQLLEKFANLGEPLRQLSKCPDLVVNRGHYFGTAQFNEQGKLTKDEREFGKEPVLSDDDKRALIAFLKTF